MRYVRATAEDQARIESFLSQFVDDYARDQIESYLASETGGLYLALDDDNQLAATGVVALGKPHEAFLGAVRLRPDMQDTSLAEEMAEFQVQEARRLGAQVVRALISRGNEASQHLFQTKLGFHVVDEWVAGSLEGFSAPEYPDEVAGPAWAVDRDRLLAFMNQHGEDLWSRDGAWQPASISFDDVWHSVELGSTALAPQTSGEALDTLAIFHIQDDRMHLQYLRSMGKHLKALLQYLWVESRAWGVKTLEFGLPRHAADKLVEASGLTMNREWHGIVLEKHVVLTTSSSA
ncbi:GNAT family N-acetyltransferase [Sulfobacillus harzensis]|uniref:GNAT family N-acetyltransferase n=1 Tax=Sulfobacillus harzensis TaxID=2729629 RepID=A0A7Y0L0F3_9FIRM|nr:GNAT family N-acetyltransferase [Sulfobacillus harzensis]